jgi:3-hydroxyacyl-[acyl-carrier-protein] dehydratase
MILDREGIQKIIPHRDPFLLIDQIIRLDVGKSAVGKLLLTADMPMFQGHFPHEPIMPGVMMIEALAQVGAVAFLADESNLGKTVYFGGIKNAKFRRKVIPGDTLVLDTLLTKRRGPFGYGIGRALVNDELACECEIMFTAL